MIYLLGTQDRCTGTTMGYPQQNTRHPCSGQLTPQPFLRLLCFLFSSSYSYLQFISAPFECFILSRWKRRTEFVSIVKVSSHLFPACSFVRFNIVKGVLPCCTQFFMSFEYYAPLCLWSNFTIFSRMQGNNIT